ncbi:MAG: threonine--tRNA ligase, partial [Clostridia bacterium]|nr:threonine--tRNA ligase [Clostridia bacterium]
TYAGALPTWMAPEQVRVMSVTERAHDYAAELAAKLRCAGFRAEANTADDKIGKKIREAQMEKVPYMLIVGDRDMADNTVSVRHRSEGDLGAMSFDDFKALLKDVVDTKVKK